jgi:3'-phosphoadenosine 5'-phosphosulfate sulfotransferase (PAPS reductase)/FAD synthetase
MNSLLSTSSSSDVDLESYSKILVMLSGGKDSVACALELKKLGVPAEKIEFWHHDVDGREGSDLFDWPITRAYCTAFAKWYGSPIYFSWKVGGLEGEMLRHGQRTAPTAFENTDGELVQIATKGGKATTRLKFPQKGKDLGTRWCSAYGKIDIADKVLRAQERFIDERTLVVTGERAEESAGRAKYLAFEPHRTDTRNTKRRASRRHVDHWRPVHTWEESQVWDIFKEFDVQPHPAYQVGFGRVSCMTCIFGNADQWATVRDLDRRRFERIAAYEEDFGCTIDRKHSVREMAESGQVYEMNQGDRRQAMATEWHREIQLKAGQWQMPSGAFKECGGPI